MKGFAAVLGLALLLPLAFVSAASSSAPVTVPLGVAEPFAVLGGAGISDVPTSVINGDVGVSPGPGTSITGLTCAEVTGTTSSVDASGPLPCRVTNPGMLTTATTNVTAAFGDAAGRTPDSTLAGADNQLGGQTLVPGVYRFGHATTANLVGNLTLAGNADAVWIFQATSDLVTAASSTVTLTGGAQSCNVFWQVASTTMLNASSTFRGTILAHDVLAVLANVTIDGRLLDNAPGAVTLISDTITKPATCVTQASIDAAAAAVVAAQAAAAAAAQAAATAQAAADQAAAAAKAADVAAAAAAATKAAAAAQAAADAATAAQVAAQKAAAIAAQAAIAKAAAVKAAKAAATAKAAAGRAARAKSVALKRATVRKAITTAGFTG
jgi:hypothetical protein